MSKNSNLDVNLKSNVQVKWEITTNNGESYLSGNIKLAPPGKAVVNIAIFKSEFNIVTYPYYSIRRWSVTHIQNTKEIVLNVINAKTEDDGEYTLELAYLSSVGTPLTDTHGIRLNVLGKLRISITCCRGFLGVVIQFCFILVVHLQTELCL